MSRAKHGWHTPDSTAGDEICRPLFLPANDEILSLAGGALAELTKPYNYEQSGAMTPAETAEYFSSVLNRWYTEPCGGGGTPTPFWDDATDTDDEFTPETQPWYGFVTDADLPADELTFVENVGIWAFTGLLALTGTPAAAILFHTTAPAFVLAMRGDDFGQVIRVIVDAEEQAEVTLPDDPDFLYELTLNPGDSDLGHDILLVLRSIL